MGEDRVEAVDLDAWLAAVRGSSSTRPVCLLSAPLPLAF